MKIVLASLFFFVAFSINGQDAKEDILKINEAYTKFNDLSMMITYNLYANYTATVISETETAMYKQHGELRYTKLKEVETLNNAEFMIVADNSEKIMIVSNPVKFATEKVTMVNLDAAFSTCSSVKFLNADSLLNGYQLSFRQDIVSTFDMIDIYFNKKTFIVEKINFYYREALRMDEFDKTMPKEKPRLEVRFLNMDFKPTIQNNYFSEKKYIEKKEGNYYPIGAYKNYKLLNHRFKN